MATNGQCQSLSSMRSNGEGAAARVAVGRQLPGRAAAPASGPDARLPDTCVRQGARRSAYPQVSRLMDRYGRPRRGRHASKVCGR
jgi:hypothetical protein